jgi:hypothetical protein
MWRKGFLRPHVVRVWHHLPGAERLLLAVLVDAPYMEIARNFQHQAVGP